MKTKNKTVIDFTKKTLVLPMSIFTLGFKGKSKKLTSAAKSIVNDEILEHFKVDSYDLDARFYISRMFETAFGESLEKYLLKSLSDSGADLQVKINGDKYLISKIKKSTRKKHKKV